MLHSIRTNCRVLSIDIGSEPQSIVYQKLKSISRCIFIQGDAINPGQRVHTNVITHLQTGRALLYCDANGYDMARRDQMEQWVPNTKPKDIIIAHDYPVQIKERQIQRLVDEFNLEPFHQEEAWKMGCRMLVYERQED